MFNTVCTMYVHKYTYLVFCMLLHWEEWGCSAVTVGKYVAVDGSFPMNLMSTF